MKLWHALRQRFKPRKTSNLEKALKAAKSSLNGHWFVQYPLLPIFSELAQREPPPEYLPMLQVCSTEASTYYCQADDVEILVWDWRWSLMCRDIIAAYSTICWASEMTASLAEENKGSVGEPLMRDLRALLRQTALRYLLERLHPNGSIWLRARDSTALRNVRREILEELSGQESNSGFQQDPRWLARFGRWSDSILSSLMSLTLDHEICHYMDKNNPHVVSRFYALVEDGFLPRYRNQPDFMTVNKFGLCGWAYFEAMESQATSRRAIELLAKSENHRSEAYADLSAAGAFVAHNMAPEGVTTRAESWDTCAGIYERGMLWQASLLFLRGLSDELERRALRREPISSFSDSELGARKLLVDHYLWWMLDGSMTPNPPSNRVEAAAHLERMNAEGRHLVMLAEERIQLFFHYLSCVGHEVSTLLDRWSTPTEHRADMSDTDIAAAILTATKFPGSGEA